MSLLLSLKNKTSRTLWRYMLLLPSTLLSHTLGGDIPPPKFGTHPDQAFLQTFIPYALVCKRFCFLCSPTFCVLLYNLLFFKKKKTYNFSQREPGVGSRWRKAKVGKWGQKETFWAAMHTQCGMQVRLH